MILDLDLSNNSFTKLLALIHDAEELLDNIDEEHRDRDSHRLSYRIYKIINENQKEEFSKYMTNYYSGLNSLALTKPYANQNILLLIDALHTVTADSHFYSELKDFLPDIKFIHIPKFSWNDYREQPAELDDKPPHEEPQNLNTNDFEDDIKTAGESIIRKPITINEKEVERRFLAQSEKGRTNTITERDIVGLHDDEFDFGSTPDDADEKKSLNLNQKREIKPWVKPFFTISGVTLFGLLVYGFF